MKRHWIRKVLSSLLIVLLLIVGVLWLLLRASLPRLAGDIALAGLNARTVIERDALGAVTVRGSHRADLARATGYAHAQDRFFQMDLLRRSSAGELAQLFGARALAFDRERRLHRMRTRAEAMWAQTDDAERRVLEAYSAGVNEGLAALRAPPFEYLLLRQRPQWWQPEDSLLVALTMYFTLQADGAEQEQRLTWLNDCLPEAMVDFLAPRGTRWDAALAGDRLALPALPTAAQFDARQLPPVDTEPAETETPAVGSNNWALSGAYTRHGSALVADDMHLGLRLPHIWYRLRLIQNAGQTPVMDISGVSLPGLPYVVVGSNGHVAWGFTNSYGDFLDLIPLQLDPDDPTRYRTPQGYETLRLEQEVVAVKGAAAVQLTVRETRWGPIVDRDHRGSPLVWRWVAHDPAALSLSAFGELEGSLSVDSALAVAQRIGMPGQNFVVGDRDGRIGWTIIGRIPQRAAGFDGRIASDWSAPDHAWRGWLPAVDYPQLIDPPGGRLWTANARVASGSALRYLGDGGYALGARAGQIRDRLLALEKADEAAMLSIQLDDEARLLSRWRRLLLSELDAVALGESVSRQSFRAAVLHWAGRAAVDDAGYRLVREFRDKLRLAVMGGLTSHCAINTDQAAEEESPYRFVGTAQSEGPLWRLVNQQPAHLLPPGAESWRALVLNAVDQVIEQALAQGGDLQDYTWGRRNRLRMAHPLSDALPLVGRWLQMPIAALPGDRDMPRVQGSRFGASQRMAVSPGYEEEGYLQLPGGQSGHPLSPFFAAGHQDWVDGRPTPFLPGASVYTLSLHPAEAE